MSTTTATSHHPHPHQLSPHTTRIPSKTPARPNGMSGKHPPGAGARATPKPAKQNNNSATAGTPSANPAASTNASKLIERRRAAGKPVDGGVGKGKKGAGVGVVTGEGGESLEEMREKIKELRSRPETARQYPETPYVITTSHILRKFAGKPPSVVVHLHQLNFRFEGQDGSFGYQSPMRMFLECLKTETIPPEVVEEFREAGTTFYDGRLIVQIHDHRTPSNSSAKTSGNKAVPGSIHNYNEWITPSPLVPYPAEKMNPKKDGPRMQEIKPPDEKRGMEGEKKQKVYTVVLHPTPASFFEEMTELASTPVPMRLGLNSSVSTPTSATTPRTPGGALSINTAQAAAKGAKRVKMMLDDETAPDFEAKHLVATGPRLILTPATTPEHAHKILTKLKDPLHCFPQPPPKARKRTVAELQADEAAAAEEERLLLFGDERRYHAHTGTAVPDSAVGDGAGASFEQNFKKFKLLEQIKANQAEERRKHQERQDKQRKIQQETEVRRAAMEARRRQELENQKLAAARAQAVATTQGGSPVLPQNPVTTAQQVNGITAPPTTRPPSGSPVMSPAQQAQQAQFLQRQHAAAAQAQAAQVAQQQHLLQQQQTAQRLASHPQPPQQQPHPPHPGTPQSHHASPRIQQLPQTSTPQPPPNANPAALAAYHQQLQQQLRLRAQQQQQQQQRPQQFNNMQQQPGMLTPMQLQQQAQAQQMYRQRLAAMAAAGGNGAVMQKSMSMQNAMRGMPGGMPGAQNPMQNGMPNGMQGQMPGQGGMGMGMQGGMTQQQMQQRMLQQQMLQQQQQQMMMQQQQQGGGVYGGQFGMGGMGRGLGR